MSDQMPIADAMRSGFTTTFEFSGAPRGGWGLARRSIVLGTVFFCGMIVADASRRIAANAQTQTVPPVRAESGAGIGPVNQLTTVPAPLPAKLSPWIYVAKVTTDPQTGVIAPSTAKQLIDLGTFSSIEVSNAPTGPIRFQESGFTTLETPRNPILEAYIRSYFSPVDLSAATATTAPAK